MSPSWLRWGSWSDHLHASSPCSPLPQPLRAPGGSASSLTHPGPERAGTRLPSGQDPGRRAGGEGEARRRASVGGHRPAPPSAGQHKPLRSSGYSFWNLQRRSGLSAATSLVF